MSLLAPFGPARSRLTGLVALLAVVGTGCSGDASQADAADSYETVAPASIAPGDEVPPPEGEVILTVAGQITNTNVGDRLELDLALLERLEIVRFTADDDEGLGREATFEGVLLADVLALAGASDDATEIFTAALNDYEVVIPSSDVERYAVMVATRTDGERMPVERYGPTRIVYPNRAVDFDPTVYNPRWNWQLATIEVR